MCLEYPFLVLFFILLLEVLRAIASIMAEKVGGKMGGIIATMPAVYLAIIALAIDHRGNQLVQMSIHLSSGAIIGIISCIITVFLTSLYISKEIIKRYRICINMLACNFSRYICR